MDRRYFLFIVVILVCLLIGSGCTPIFTEPESRKSKIVYDISDDDDVLVETKAPCPRCGQDAYGYDGSIICRNKDCEMYGIANEIN